MDTIQPHVHWIYIALVAILCKSLVQTEICFLHTEVKRHNGNLGVNKVFDLIIFLFSLYNLPNLSLHSPTYHPSDRLVPIISLHPHPPISFHHKYRSLVTHQAPSQECLSQLWSDWSNSRDTKSKLTVPWWSLLEDLSGLGSRFWRCWGFIVPHGIVRHWRSDLIYLPEWRHQLFVSQWGWREFCNWEIWREQRNICIEKSLRHCKLNSNSTKLY